MAYDRCVERRQRNIMYSAMKKLKEANRRIVESSAKQLQHFASSKCALSLFCTVYVTICCPESAHILTLSIVNFLRSEP